MPRKATAPFVMPILNPVKVESFYKNAELKYEQLCTLMDIKDGNKYFKKTDFHDDSIFKKIWPEFKTNENCLKYVFAQICYHMQNNPIVSKILKFDQNGDYIIKLFDGITNIDENNFNTIADNIFDKVKSYPKIKWNDNKRKTEKESLVLTYIKTILRWVAFFIKYKNQIKNRNDLFKYFKHILNSKERINVVDRIKQISGFNKIAYCCDLLKELFKDSLFDICKPDTHIMNVAKALTGNNKLTEYDAVIVMDETVKVINIYSKKTNIYKLDRMLYLLLSINFFLDKNKHGFHDHYLHNLVQHPGNPKYYLK